MSGFRPGMTKLEIFRAWFPRGTQADLDRWLSSPDVIKHSMQADVIGGTINPFSAQLLASRYSGLTWEQQKALNAKIGFVYNQANVTAFWKALQSGGLAPLSGAQAKPAATQQAAAQGVTPVAKMSDPLPPQVATSNGPIMVAIAAALLML